jgi:hypothetical protein
MYEDFQFRLEPLKAQLTDDIDFLRLTHLVKMVEHSASLAFTNIENAVVARIDIRVDIILQTLSNFGRYVEVNHKAVYAKVLLVAAPSQGRQPSLEPTFPAISGRCKELTSQHHGIAGVPL